MAVVEKAVGAALTLRIALLLAGLLPGIAASVEITTPADSLSLADLEERLAGIDAELDQLASYSLRSGVGNVGYRSQTHEQAASKEWIQIELEKETTIDQVVLVPSIWRDSKTGFRADGFPLEFRIVAGTGNDTDSKVLASFGPEDHLLPRIAPLVVACSGTTASRVRVEASVLSPRAWDGAFILQLFEILVFSGRENVALHRPVETSSPERYEGPGRHRRFLVDGSVPYLMDAAQGEQSVAFLSGIGIGDQPTLTIDLGESRPLHRIHLHGTDVSDTVPQAISDDFGVPRRLVVDGANQADFSDAVHLMDYRMESIYDAGPLIIRRFPETPCRHVRLTAIEPFMNARRGNSGSQIGFAEIEIFSGERNVARGREIRANFETQSPDRHFSALTDGHNLYGRILPIRDWMNELARRHELETARPLILAELDRRHARQKANLARMGWLASLLAAATVIIVLADRITKQRAIHRIRKRIAADLHDELGANLHAIGLLSDLAGSAKDKPEKLGNILQRMRRLTERTGDATRYCTNMLEAEGLFEDVAEDMRRSSRRIMADLDHQISFEGEGALQKLPPRKRTDLCLFYKECLANILRHSGATEVSTQVTASGRNVRLVITDNGQGIADPDANQVPSSLKRRARLLGARVMTEQPEQGGTRITLNLKTGSLGLSR